MRHQNFFMEPEPLLMPRATSSGQCNQTNTLYRGTSSSCGRTRRASSWRASARGAASSATTTPGTIWPPTRSTTATLANRIWTVAGAGRGAGATARIWIQTSCPGTGTGNKNMAAILTMSFTQYYFFTITQIIR
jgi:hypothetical protein